MKRITVEASNFENIQWPAQCPACCGDVLPDDKKSVIKLKKGVKATFCKVPKDFALPLCANCQQRKLNYILVERVGWGLIAVAIIGPIYLMHSESAVPPAELYNAAGGAFGLGWIVMMIGSSLKTNIAGLKCMLKSRDTWTFTFRSAEFAKQFAELNAPRIKASVGPLLPRFWDFALQGRIPTQRFEEDEHLLAQARAKKDRFFLDLADLAGTLMLTNKKLHYINPSKPKAEFAVVPSQIVSLDLTGFKMRVIFRDAKGKLQKRAYKLFAEQADSPESRKTADGVQYGKEPSVPEFQCAFKLWRERISGAVKLERPD